MPVVYQQNINAYSRLGIWHITEGEYFFYEHVPLQNNITHPHKRLQHLAGRYLLKLMFPDFPLSLILIADTKKPFLADEAYHFSISHCGDYAAVMVSSKNRVGVDIEIVQPKVELIKNKFLSAEEQELVFALGKKYLTAAWSIKETLYKWYGLGQVDFIKDLQIKDIVVNAHGFTAHCFFQKHIQQSLDVHGFFLEEKSVCWLVSEPDIYTGN